MVSETRLLWYFPSFELEGKYPGGYRTLALAKALVRNGVSHVVIASILLKESRKISDNIELFALPHNPLIVWKSLRSARFIETSSEESVEHLICGF